MVIKSTHKIYTRCIKFIPSPLDQTPRTHLLIHTRPPTIMGNLVMGFQELSFVFDFYSVGQSKTSVDSSECPPEFSESFLEQFSVSAESIFFNAANQFSLKGRK